MKTLILPGISGRCVAAVVLSLSSAVDAAVVLELTKTVDDGVPAPGTPVEFVVEVVNGGDEPALAIEVEDVLPSGLAIPAGPAAFPASGSYDLATGMWTVGDLDPGEGSTLVLSAMLDTPNPPLCVVNIARAVYEDEFGPVEVESRAAVRDAAGTRCADLEVAFGLQVGEFVVFPECDKFDRYRGSVTVTNRGPDAAQEVFVSIRQDPVVGPNLRFEDADCLDAPSSVCRIPQLASADSVDIDITSDPFQSHEQFTQTVSVSAETSDIDYERSNDSPISHGTAGGFSNCAQIDFGIEPWDIGVPACFIATAAYGSPLHAHVETLRRFRDRHLLSNAPGRAFVAYYYRHSPAIARHIGARPWLRALVRWLLAPLVYAIAYPLAATLLVTAGLPATILWRRRRVRRIRRRLCHEGGPLTG